MTWYSYAKRSYGSCLKHSAWQTVFTLTLAIVVAVLLQTATSVSTGIGEHLTTTAMDGVFLASMQPSCFKHTYSKPAKVPNLTNQTKVERMMGTMEDSMISMTENSLVNDLANLDPNTQYSGISSVDMTLQTDVLGGPLYSACYQYSQCGATGFAIGDISFIGYGSAGYCKFVTEFNNTTCTRLPTNHVHNNTSNER